MLGSRLTYVPLDVANQFEDFIIARDEEVLDAVKARTKEFNTLSLLKLLYQLNTRPMSFSDLYTRSKIRMKRSFLNYLRLCVDYSFVEKEADGPHMIYSITGRGRLMLSLFMKKGNCQMPEMIHSPA